VLGYRDPKAKQQKALIKGNYKHRNNSDYKTTNNITAQSKKEKN
jgi:hypothetical protein